MCEEIEKKNVTEDYIRDLKELTKRYVADCINLVKYYRDDINVEQDLLFLYEFKEVIEDEDNDDGTLDAMIPVFNRYIGSKYVIMERARYDEMLEEAQHHAILRGDQKAASCFDVFNN